MTARVTHRRYLTLVETEQPRVQQRGRRIGERVHHTNTLRPGVDIKPVRRPRRNRRHCTQHAKPERATRRSPAAMSTDEIEEE
jgi:hypothetical protein